MSNHVWLTYNDPAYIIQRHSIEGFERFIENSANALSDIAQANVV
jgi:hypothetical protein